MRLQAEESEADSLVRDEDAESSKKPRNKLARVLAAAGSVFRAAAAAFGRWVRSGAFVRSLVRLYMLGLLCAVGWFGFQKLTRSRPAPPSPMLYSNFVTAVKSKQVSAVRFEDATGRIYFRPKPDAVLKLSSSSSSSSSAAAAASASSSSTRPSAAYPFYTRRMPTGVADSDLVPMLVGSGVEFGSVATPLSATISRALLTLCALWIPLVPLFFIMRSVMNGRTGRGSKRKPQNGDAEAAKPTTFADVAGVDSAKRELMEVVEVLQNSERYRRVGAKAPTGVLLIGPPGTGKTLLAKAVAGETGASFYAVAASEFVELFVGRGAARVRELFAGARKRGPAVVFIDELDAIGAKRGVGMNEERDQTLNQLLVELDGFQGNESIVVLAATNRPEALDPALMRPGRLSRKVYVGRPDEPGRASILAVHLRGKPLAEEADVLAPALAASPLTRDFSGAELANVVDEAALLAAREGSLSLTRAHLLEAASRTRFGVGTPELSPLRKLIRAAASQTVAANTNPAFPDSRGTGGAGGGPGFGLTK